MQAAANQHTFVISAILYLYPFALLLGALPSFPIYKPPAAAAERGHERRTAGLAPGYAQMARASSNHGRQEETEAEACLVRKADLQ
jgi:hypothetical protein